MKASDLFVRCLENEGVGPCSPVILVAGQQSR